MLEDSIIYLEDHHDNTAAPRRRSRKKKGANENHNLIKAVANEFKVYVNKTRKEEAFDLSNTHVPMYDVNKLEFNKLFGFSTLDDNVMKYTFRNTGPKRSLSSQTNKRETYFKTELLFHINERKERLKKRKLENACHNKSDRAIIDKYIFPRKQRPKSMTTKITQPMVPSGLLSVRNKPTSYVTKGEKQRLIETTTKILSATDDIFLMATAPPNPFNNTKVNANFYAVDSNRPNDYASPRPFASLDDYARQQVEQTAKKDALPLISPTANNKKQSKKTKPKKAEKVDEEEANYEFTNVKQVKSGPIIKYRVVTNTGARQGSGTDAKIKLQLFGTNGKSAVMGLDDSLTNKIPFQRSNKDVFDLEMYDVGEVKAISIGHTESDIKYSWYLDSVIIEDISNKLSYEFKADKWFKVDSEDQKTIRTFFKPVITTIIRTEKKESHHVDKLSKRNIEKLENNDDNDSTHADGVVYHNDYKSQVSNTTSRKVHVSSSSSSSMHSDKKEKKDKKRSSSSSSTSSSSSSSSSSSDSRAKEIKVKRKSSVSSGSRSSASSRGNRLDVLIAAAKQRKEEETKKSRSRSGSSRSSSRSRQNDVKQKETRRKSSSSSSRTSSRSSSGSSKDKRKPAASSIVNTLTQAYSTTRKRTTSRSTSRTTTPDTYKASQEKEVKQEKKPESISKKKASSSSSSSSSSDTEKEQKKPQEKAVITLIESSIPKKSPKKSSSSSSSSSSSESDNSSKKRQQRITQTLIDSTRQTKQSESKLSNKSSSNSSSDSSSKVSETTSAKVFDALNQNKLDELKDILHKNPNAVRARNNEDQSLLALACQLKYNDIVAYLIKAKDELINISTPAGLYPVHYSAKYNNVKALELLFENGASLTVKSNGGLSPLHLAAMCGKLEACKYLVSKNVDIFSKDENDRTPIDLAAKYNHQDVADFLKKSEESYSKKTVLQTQESYISTQSTIDDIDEKDLFDNFEKNPHLNVKSPFFRPQRPSLVSIPDRKTPEEKKSSLSLKSEKTEPDSSRSDSTRSLRGSSKIEETKKAQTKKDKKNSDSSDSSDSEFD